MLELIEILGLARDSRAPVLITGETGTGKELLARAAHALSARRNRAFTPFNCATSIRELIKSELFGHLRGSFTGASNDSKGIIRTAEGGTLLLDEIGELSLEVQPQLLRFLQEGEVHPVGAAKPVKTDVCVIAATNRDLEEEVRAGRFRADLFERLNVLRLHIPPLRERREDIPPLIEYFFEHYLRQEHKHGMRLGDEAGELLFKYDWPRNVRQLENEVRRLVLRARNDELIGPERISSDIKTDAHAQPASSAAIVGSNIVIALSLPCHEAIEALERLKIEHALKITGGNREQVAANVGMSRDGLRKAIKRLNIKTERGRRHKPSK
ncbi:MAG: sigma 54-interacting transcriptional regulator [Blastocatellia bacterium]